MVLLTFCLVNMAFECVLFYLGTKLVAFISQDVKEDEHLSISYSLNVSEIYNNTKRQEEIEERWRFNCSCDKCKSNENFMQIYRNRHMKQDILELETSLHKIPEKWHPRYGGKVDAYLRRIQDPSYIH